MARRIRYELARALLPAALERDRPVRFDHNLRIRVAPAEVVDRSIYLHGVHEPLTSAAFCALCPLGGVVLDIGAHIGQFTLLAAKRVGPTGRVLAFEPNPETRTRLDANVALNGLANVTVVAEGLAAQSGTRRLYFGGEAHNIGAASLDAKAGQQWVEVTCARLDDVVEREGVGRVDLVKLDVEGAEVEVLEGGGETMANHRPAVVFEANEGAEAALRILGYEVFGIATSSSGAPRLLEVGPDDDPARFREPWAALNLVAVHPGGRG